MSTIRRAVDKIVEHICGGTAKSPISEEAAFCAWALETGFDGEWDGGTVVPEDLIPTLGPDHVHFLNDRLPESRLSELEDGAASSSDEAKLFREVWLDAMCLEGEADADVIPGYIWHTLAATQVRPSEFLVGVEYEWLGFYTEIGELYHALRGIGHLDVDRRERRQQ